MWVMEVELIFPKFFNNLFMQFGSWWHGGWLCFNGERGFWGGWLFRWLGLRMMAVWMGFTMVAA